MWKRNDSEGVYDMKRKTYNNVLKAIKMLQDKGYDFTEASQLALNVFEQHENEERTIEFYIGLIIPKKEFETQYSLSGGKENARFKDAR